MELEPEGQLVPIGGGDRIPLRRQSLKIGRRHSCDICLRFPNISGQHCELNWVEGYWQLVDLGSTNGTKVNNVRIQKKTLRPGDEIAIGKRRYTIQYELPKTSDAHVFEEIVGEDVMNQSLLEKAGLIHRRDEDEVRPAIKRKK